MIAMDGYARTVRPSARRDHAGVHHHLRRFDGRPGDLRRRVLDFWSLSASGGRLPILLHFLYVVNLAWLEGLRQSTHCGVGDRTTTCSPPVDPASGLGAERKSINDHDHGKAADNPQKFAHDGPDSHAGKVSKKLLGDVTSGRNGCRGRSRAPGSRRLSMQ